MIRVRGWAVKGRRCYGRAPGSWKSWTMLSSIRCNGENEGIIFEGAVNKEIFKSFIEDALLPTLQKEEIIVMDNLRTHKIKFNERRFRRKGLVVKYFPRYSPNLNPIENMWSQVNGKIRADEPRGELEIWRSVNYAHLYISPENAAGWFRGCGYFH